MVVCTWGVGIPRVTHWDGDTSGITHRGVPVHDVTQNADRMMLEVSIW